MQNRFSVTPTHEYRENYKTKRLANDSTDLANARSAQLMAQAKKTNPLEVERMEIANKGAQATQENTANDRRDRTFAIKALQMQGADPETKAKMLPIYIEKLRGAGLDEQADAFEATPDEAITATVQAGRINGMLPKDDSLEKEGKRTDIDYKKAMIAASKAPKAPASTPQITNAKFLNDPNTSQAEKDALLAQIQKTGQKISVDKDGNVTISEEAIGGASDLSSTTKSNIQKGLIELKDQKVKLEQVRSDFDPRALTYKGKILNGFNTIKEKLGGELDPEEMERLASGTKFINGVEQAFNTYRKYITGAAASVQELDRLKKSMINGNLSETQFNAAFDQFYNQVNTGISLYEELLSIGISPAVAQKAVDDSFKSGPNENAFRSVEEAEAAVLPVGTKITINGRPAIVE